MGYTVAFDVYGTLIDTSGVFDALQPLVGAQATSFMDTWRNKQLEYAYRRGLMQQYADFSVCTKDALVYCCRLFKIQLSTQQQERLMQTYSVLPAFADVTAGLESIQHAGHRLFAFSNGSKMAVEKLLTNAKINSYFDGMVSVEDVKSFKPNPLVYEYFNKASLSQKTETYLVSSNPFDVIGAKAYGMRAIWLQRSPDAVFDPWGIDPDFVIHQLTDLNDL